MPNISLIITVKNESSSIESLLTSIVAQKRLPDEVVIADGGSTDDTLSKVKQFLSQKNQIKSWQVDSGPYNISQGRNRAIELAHYDLIAITDAGCTLNVSWLAELEQTFLNAKKDQKTEVVVAGYYQGAPQSQFEQAVVPYVLVMPDQVDAETFLPATRSMLLPRKIWHQLGGFNEALQVSEDFAFAHQVVDRYGTNQIVFSPKAVVYWRPRSDLKSFWTMIYKMAEGDIRAGIYRGKVKLLFGRYIGGLLVLTAILKSGSAAGWLFLTAGFMVYLAWSVTKNKKYVGSAWLWLPILQLTADVAVMTGTLSGLWYQPSAK